MDGASKDWPAWYNGPDGTTRIFNSPDEVPAGWTTGSEAKPLIATGAAPVPPPPPAAPPAKTGAAPVTAAAKPAKGAAAPELDAHGHPWSAELHAGTKAKTKAGLWRMAVGKSRPAPMTGYPLDL